MKLTAVEHNPFKKVAKASVFYSKGMKSSHCGICEFYSNRACSKVAGEIDPAYWCRLFVRKRKGFAEGGAPEMTAPFPEAPGGYPFFTADSASDTPSGVLPSDLPPVDVPPAERGPIAGFLDQLSAPSKYAMEPDLQQTQTGATEGPKGVAPQNLGMNDAGQYVDMGTGEPIPEEPQTRRPNVLPLTIDPSGKPEMAMPKVLDVASNIIGGNVPGGAGTILGSGFARAAKDIAPIPNELGFYSATQHAIETAPQAKASPQQWMGMLRNAPGVKQEEMKWLGLDEWLQSQKGPVTKEQVADFVKANNIEIKEVTKGGEPDLREQRISEIDAQIRELSNWPDENTVAQDPTKQPQLDTLLKEWDSINDDATPSPSPTKFSSYTLPGGQNYRELLLTLPAGKPIGQIPSSGVGRPHEQIYAEPTFKSSHWDEPNVLAHIRFDDRVIDGKKALHIAEIQSDWAQKGRRTGFAQGEPKSIQSFKPEDLKMEQTEHQYVGTSPDGRKNVVGKGTVGSEEEAREYLARYMNKMSAEKNMAALTEHRSKVPNMPFKTTWPELSLKRILKYAADNGYEKVSWDNGSTQAARYDLSKHVDRIGYTDRGDGTYNISASRGDLGIFEEDRVDAKRLQELVGKDMAEKITKGEGRTYDTYQNHVTRELTGLDLKVGGEGMKGFYDQILPATVNKLVKKFGAKVERGNIKTKASDVDPAHWVRSSESGEWSPPEKAQQVHSVNITQQMKKAISEQGFPQFSTGGSVKPRLTPIAHDPWEAHSAARRAMHGHKHT